MDALVEKVAVVTGAASGIGRACVTRLAALGATVVAVDIAGDEVQVVAEAVGAVAVRADVSVPADWTAVVESVRSLGGVDFVCGFSIAMQVHTGRGVVGAAWLPKSTVGVS